MGSGDNSSSDDSADTTADVPVGSGDYVVAEGDCLNSIAFDYGFFWQTLWDLPANSELKSTRKDPDMLLPGDLITIPPLRLGQKAGSDGKRHTFKWKGVPAHLRFRFLEDGKPLSNADYVLEVDGAKTGEGTLDEDGELNHSISPSAKSAVVSIGDSEPKIIHRFNLGTVPPISSRIGVMRRLQNLGYRVDDSDPSSLNDAITSFQQENNVTVTGTIDQPTRDKLAELHGC